MKDLILPALNDAYTKLEKQIPSTKNDLVEVCIDDVNPMDLPQFMVDNNIPEDAWFGTEESQTLGSCTRVLLLYDIKIPTTDKDKLLYKRKRYTSIAFSCISNVLLVNGYKRKGFNSGLLKSFDDTTVYDMYINKEYDRLVNYYSLSFGEIQ